MNRHLPNLNTHLQFLDFTVIVNRNAGQYLLDICRRRHPLRGVGWSSDHIRLDNRRPNEQDAHSSDHRSKPVVPAMSTNRSVIPEYMFYQLLMRNTAAIGNAVLVFVTFMLSVPAMVIPSTRGWLKFTGYMTVACALYTMVLGLTLWFQTLRTRENLLPVWNALPSTSQSLLQQEFSCCGYKNSTSPPFVVDSTCPNALVAASTVGCVGPFSSFGNNFLDLIFTGAFGIVGMCCHQTKSLHFD